MGLTINVAAGSGTFPVTLQSSTVPIHTPSLAVLNGYWFGTGTLTATFSGLVPDASYNLDVFGLRAFTLNNTVTITGSGPPVTFDQLGSAGQLFVNGQVGSSGSSLESFARTISASSSGKFVITVQQKPGSSTTGWAVAGLAIEPSVAAVPEPASLTLLGIAAVGLICYGWRKRKRAAA